MNVYMEHRLTVWKICPVCRKKHWKKFRCTDEQYINYMIGTPIQLVFPDMDKYKREFLKSGTCVECQKEIF